jgi:hypothetical protein
MSKAGNSQLRKHLFFPAMSAMRYNPICQVFAARLKAQGKPQIVINQLFLTIAGGSGTGGSANAAAKITQAGIDGSNHPFFTFDSVAGESYEIQCSTDLLSWTPMATLSGTGGSVTYTDEFTQAPSVPRQFRRAKTVLTPNGNLANTTLSITQTWAQQSSGYARTAVVEVPTGAGPHPVIILLHGNGGTGAGTIGALGTSANTAIHVAPEATSPAGMSMAKPRRHPMWPSSAISSRC